MPINANADGPLVDIQSVNPTIVVELRYAGNNNLVKHPLYPQGTRALARPEVVAALTKAQTTLRRLSIWTENLGRLSAGGRTDKALAGIAQQ